MTTPKATVATAWHHSPAEWRKPSPAPKPTPDAPKIAAMKTAHHPALAQLTRDLAATPGMTLELAAERLGAEMERQGIHMLDLEMCQPGAACRVPFSPTASPSPGGEFQANVAGHVRALLEDKR